MFNLRNVKIRQLGSNNNTGTSNDNLNGKNSLNSKLLSISDV